MASMKNPQIPSAMRMAAVARGSASSGRVNGTMRVSGKSNGELAADARGGHRDPNGREIPKIRTS